MGYVPNMRCTKSQRGGEPTNRRLNGAGGVCTSLGARGPHLRIIVYKYKINFGTITITTHYNHLQNIYWDTPH